MSKKMIVATVVKPFSSAKDKDGNRLIGFNPVLWSVRRFNQKDFDICKKHGLVKEGIHKPGKAKEA